MRQTPLQRLLITLVGWGAALLMFFPIFWTVLTSFKSENEAIRPSLAFTPTLPVASPLGRLIGAGKPGTRRC